MARNKRLLADDKRALKERLGLVGIALVFNKEHGEVAIKGRNTAGPQCRDSRPAPYEAFSKIIIKGRVTIGKQ